LVRKFRPTYLAILFKFLASLAPGHHLAWDCVTGSGQATIALADDRRSVCVTDISDKQVAHAKHHEKVRYQSHPPRAA
jgi:methylase of polypeptide subunit release factors